LNKVIGDNETGFRGTNDAPYRTEAWDFVIAGGGLFNHLDYSFVAGHEDGTFVYPKTQPGGGNTVLRRQFRILRDFIHRFEFIRMKPDNSVVEGGVPPGGTARALVEPGKAWAVYLRQQSSTGPLSARGTGLVVAEQAREITLAIRLPAGQFEAEWVDTKTGQSAKSETFQHPGGARSLAAPAFQEDIALRVVRK
jgi:hypothetical protein